MNEILRASALAVGYGDRPVREGVAASLHSGELICLLGRNGAGKSTLLRALGGLTKPLAGQVEVRVGEEAGERAGEWLDLHAMGPRQRAHRLGIILPERVDLGLMTSRELINLGRHPYTGWSGRLSEKDRIVVDASLAELGIEALARRTVGSLSDGERQKVMIARALAQEPEIFLLDEPTAFLDLPGRVEVLKLLRELSRKASRAVLVSTHDLDLAMRLADRLWVLPSEGGLLDGTPQELAVNGALASAFESPAAAEILQSILEQSLPSS